MAGVIIALDAADREAAMETVDQLDDGADFYKVGLELYTAEGPAIVRELRDRGKRVFLDLKLHDIPTTVARAVRAAVALDVHLLTVHAVGGRAMLEAAVRASEDGAGSDGNGGLGLLAVTVLTSASAAEVETSWGRSIHSVREEVVRLASLAADSGVGGAVASALEAAAIRRNGGPNFLLVTPGIRLSGGDRHDQSRVATPREAIEAGANWLVVGRAVTAAPDPSAALQRVRTELEEAAV